MPEFARTAGDPKEFGDKLKAIVAKHGIDLEYDASIAPAQGVSSGGRVRLVPGLSAAEEFSVLAHELAHEMLHHQKDAAPLSKMTSETQAEAVAFVVCRGVGLDTNTAATDYISLYKGDKDTLAESLAVIQEASARILEDLLPEKKMTSIERAQQSAVPQIAQASTPVSERGALASSSPIPEKGVVDSQDLVSQDR